MNIFGVGGAELVLIILIMLIVAGPQRMIRWAYHLGRFTAMLRDQWSQMMDVVQKEVDAAGMDVKVPRDLPTRQNINKYIQQAAKPWADQVEATMKEVRDPVQDTVKQINQVQSEAKKSLNSAGKEIKQANKELQTAGTWSGEKAQATSAKAASAGDATPDASRPADTASNFGAWTTPNHPSQSASEERRS